MFLVILAQKNGSHDAWSLVLRCACPARFEQAFFDPIGPLDQDPLFYAFPKLKAPIFKMSPVGPPTDTSNNNTAQLPPTDTSSRCLHGDGQHDADRLMLITLTDTQ